MQTGADGAVTLDAWQSRVISGNLKTRGGCPRRPCPLARSSRTGARRARQTPATRWQSRRTRAPACALRRSRRGTCSHTATLWTAPLHGVQHPPAAARVPQNLGRGGVGVGEPEAGRRRVRRAQLHHLRQGRLVRLAFAGPLRMSDSHRPMTFVTCASGGSPGSLLGSHSPSSSSSHSGGTCLQLEV